jgi:acyl-CoA thioester hydrolase
MRTTIKEKPSVRITFFYEIFNEQDTLINEGETQLVFIDMKSNKPCRAPGAMLNVLTPYFT